MFIISKCLELRVNSGIIIVLLPLQADSQNPVLILYKNTDIQRYKQRVVGIGIEMRDDMVARYRCKKGETSRDF